jgi:hypothetical protein
MDGAKKYIKNCCYEVYITGSHNHHLSYDKRNEMIVKKPVAKILLLNSTPYYVYEVNEKKKFEKVKFSDSTKYEFKRDIIFNPQDQNTYKIMTNSEFKKYQKTLEKEEAKKQIKSVVEQSIKSTDKLTDTNGDIHYIYLLKERTAIESNINVYKIGKSTQENYKRINSYHKGFKLLLHIKCDNCHNMETQIINSFKDKYTQYDKFGTEYFEGDYKNMMKDIVNMVLFNE